MDEWKELEWAVHELPYTIFYGDNGVDYSADEHEEYRLESIKLALELLPVIREACGSVCPVPEVCVSPEGPVRFRWIKRDPLRQVACYTSAEDKIVGIMKCIGQVGSTWESFVFTLEDQFNKEKIKETLQRFLKDVQISNE